MKKTGIYIHIPFCVSKCAYCDFYSLPKPCHSEALKSRYIDAVIRQFAQTEAKLGKLSVSSVFIGGGTPTTLSEALLSKLILALNKHFDLTLNQEFTIEANPKTFDIEKLKAMKELGVNRISLGVQSANENELKAIGRIHSFDEAKNAFDLTRKAEFDNISVDLMYGLPYQTEVSFLQSVTEIAKLSPEHISIYGLQLEKGTPLYNQKDVLPFPTEDESISMYSKAIALLRQNGYERYEISNFAKPGRESKHNVGYWSQKEYLGFGAGAYSFFDGVRFSTKADVDAFCECHDFDELKLIDEVLSDEEAADEFLMLALRLAKGVSLSELEYRTRKSDIYLKRCDPYLKSGHMKIENDRLSFTESGFFVSNTILADILF